MTTTKELANSLNCSARAINKAVLKACDVYNLDPEQFGKPRATDRRVREFSENEVELILEFAPKFRDKFQESFRNVPETVPEDLGTFQENQEHAITPEVVPSGMIVKSVQPVLQFNVQSVTFNLPMSDATKIDGETEQMKNLAAQAFGAIKSYVSADFKGQIETVISQNSHVVAGIQAQAALEALQALQNQSATQPQK